MDSQRATELVAQIRLSVDSIRERLVELYDGRGWLALGYDSWADMCAAEFDGADVGRLLPVDRRRELVGDLTEHGLSSRAIGSALGIDQSTVVRDRAAAGDADASPDDDQPAVVVGLDGKRYVANPKALAAAIKADPKTAAVVRQALVEAAATPEHLAIVNSTPTPFPGEIQAEAVRLAGRLDVLAHDLQQLLDRSEPDERAQVVARIGGSHLAKILAHEAIADEARAALAEADRRRVEQRDGIRADPSSSRKPTVRDVILQASRLASALERLASDCATLAPTIDEALETLYAVHAHMAAGLAMFGTAIDAAPISDGSLRNWLDGDAEP